MSFPTPDQERRWREMQVRMEINAAGLNAWMDEMSLEELRWAADCQRKKAVYVDQIATRFEAAVELRERAGR